MEEFVGYSAEIDEKIRKTQKWFSDAAKEILLLLDPIGNIRYVNASFKKILQYSSCEVMDRPILDFVHPEDRERTRDDIYQVQSNQGFRPNSNRYIRKDGSHVRLYWLDAHLLEDGWVQATGQPTLVNQETIQAFRSHSPGLGHFFNLTDDAAVVYDLEGRVILLNPAFERLYGWNTEEIWGSILPNVPEGLEEEFFSLTAQIINGKKLIHQQTLRKKKDGSIIPISLLLSPIFDEGGAVVAITAIKKDLTPFLETEQLLDHQKKVIAERERLLSDIADHISEVICLFDFEVGQYLYVSPSCDRLWGIGIDKMLQNEALMEEKFFPEEAERVKDIFTLPHRNPVELEYRVKLGNKGNVRWIRTKITPIIGRNGMVSRTISVSEDISEWKKKDLELKRQDKLEVLGQLAAGIAHEIRNPLTTVKGFMQLQLNGSISQYSQIVLSELDQIESIVNEFLLLAKPHGEGTFEKDDINRIIQEVTAFTKADIPAANIRYQLDLSDGMRPILCERKQIRQMLINLIKNSIEAMPDGGTIYVGTINAGDSALIEVRDEGSGIPKEWLDRIGEPFYSNKERGTGMGLMVCCKIIENHGGTIQFSSEEGIGTTIHISLPAMAGLLEKRQ
ncbi:MAG TPA: PAS domain S-box protein [Bacillaceae bacterium]